jgi:hypothetical protein
MLIGNCVSQVRIEFTKTHIISLGKWKYWKFNCCSDSDNSDYVHGTIFIGGALLAIAGSHLMVSEMLILIINYD